MALAHHPAGEARDGARGDGGVLALLASSRGVRHHKVDGALSGAADLEKQRRQEPMRSHQARVNLFEIRCLQF